MCKDEKVIIHRDTDKPDEPAAKPNILPGFQDQEISREEAINEFKEPLLYLFPKGSQL